MKRHTIQQSLTLEAVQKLKCHPTADEVYQAVSAEHPTVSRGTVYRNLNRLAQSGEIASMDIPSGAGHFDYRRDKHYHARCLHCGRVFDVDMDYIPDLEDEIRDTHGFAFSGYDLVFKGVCTNCQKAEAASEKQKSACGR